MRYWIAALVCALLVHPVRLLAQDATSEASMAPATSEAPPASTDTAPPVPPAVQAAAQAAETPASGRAELVLAGRNDGKEAGDFRFRMGDDVEIAATGGAAASIQAELAKSASSRLLTLYIDDVPMVHLPMTATTGATAGEIRLHVHLFRDPNDDDNRDAWNTMLRDQEGYSMEPDLALAIGSKPAQDVRSAFPFQLYVAPRAAIGWTLAGGLLLFAGAFFLLIKSDAALRDKKGGPYSLGRSQMAFWGLLVVLAFVGVWLLTDTMERIPPQVLILLGISGATGLGSIMIGSTPKAGMESSLAPVPSRQPSFWRDICSGTEGLSIHRLQVVVWTLVLGAVFIRAVAQAISMPEFSQTLLVLMGISNGTYLGFKVPEAQ